MQLLVHKAADTDTDTDTDMYIVDVGVVNNRTWLAMYSFVTRFRCFICSISLHLCRLYVLFTFYS